MAGHDDLQSQLTACGYDLGRFHVVDIAGECDLATRRDLWDVLVDALTQPTGAVILDLSDLTFCEGWCAELILAASQGRHLAVTGIHGATARVFDLLDPTHLVTRHQSVDMAAWSLSGLPDLGPRS